MADSLPAESASVVLYNTDGETIVGFTFADSLGLWSLAASTLDTALLSIRYLGYLPQETILVPEHDSASTIVTFLEPDLQILPAIELREEKIGIKRSGDTLLFEVEVFRDGTEQNLADVLRKLPGLDILDDGTIRYMGRTVDQLFLEGKNILNNQHKLAGEALRADQLQTIKIIERYKSPKEALSGAASEKVALDIQLKDQEKTKWSGNQEVGLGAPKKYWLASNAILVKKKSGVTLFGRSNNVGEPILTGSDYLRLKSSAWEALKELGTSGDLDDIIPSYLQIQQDINYNLDGMLAGNIELKPAKQWQITGSATSIYLKRERALEISRIYYPDSIPLNAISLQQNQTPLTSFSINGQWLEGKKWFAEIELSGEFRQNRTVQEEDGIFDLLGYQFENKTEDRSFHWKPEVFIRFQPEQGLVFETNIWLHERNVTQDIELADIRPIYDLPSVPIDSLYFFNQKINLFQRNFYASVSMEKGIKNWDLKARLAYSSSMDDLDLIPGSAAASEFFSGNFQMLVHRPSMKLFLFYKSSQWSFEPSIEITGFIQNYQFAEESSWLNVQPAVFIRRTFGKSTFLTFKYSISNKLPQIKEIAEGIRAVDTRQALSGGLPSSILLRSHTLAINYSYFNLPQKRILSIACSAGFQNPSPLTASIPKGSYILQSFVEAPGQKNFNLSVFAGSPVLNLPVKADFNTSASVLSSYIWDSGNVQPLRIFNQSLGAGIRSSWKRKVNYQVGIQWSFSRQNFFGTIPSQSFSILEPRWQLSYAPSRQIILESACRLQYGISELDTQLIFYLDVSIHIQPRGWPFQLFFNGNNLTNWNPTSQVQATFTPAFSEQSRFEIFPGFLLVGLKWMPEF